MTELFAALQIVTGVAVSPMAPDTGFICRDDARASAIVERYATSLPRGADVVLKILPEPRRGAIVEVSVVAVGEPPSGERHLVNSCDEAYAFLDFYLSVWAPVEAVEVQPKATTPATTNIPPSVFLGAFGQTSTSHPDGVALGAGLGLDLALDSARLGAFGVWYQPILLKGPPESASYDLQRFDLGGNLCAKAASSPVSIWPCLGISVRRFTIPPHEAGDDADLELAIASADAALIAGRSITSSLALEVALSVRHSMMPIDLDGFQVGDFSPASFEVGLRFGITWDVPQFFHSPKEAIASREELQPW